jgi:hypothetical protein
VDRHFTQIGDEGLYERRLHVSVHRSLIGNVSMKYKTDSSLVDRVKQRYHTGALARRPRGDAACIGYFNNAPKRSTAVALGACLGRSRRGSDGSGG